MQGQLNTVNAVGAIERSKRIKLVGVLAIAIATREGNSSCGRLFNLVGPSINPGIDGHLVRCTDTGGNFRHHYIQ
jgi:hypothetical protein